MYNFLYGVIVSLSATAIWHFLVNRERDVRISSRVFDINIPDQEDKFYLALRKAFSNARREVFQYAEGFATSPQDRLSVAKDYVSSIQKILSDNPKLTWTRIQTRNPCSEEWFLLLQSLVYEFPTRFKLFMLDNQAHDHAISVGALIDPKTKRNESYLLVSKPENRGGDESVNVADVGLMIKGSERWSKSLEDQLNRMRNPDSTYVEFVTPKTKFNRLFHSSR